MKYFSLFMCRKCDEKKKNVDASMLHVGWSFILSKNVVNEKWKNNNKLLLCKNDGNENKKLNEWMNEEEEKSILKNVQICVCVFFW